jgi:hypothetical protein
MLRGSFFFETHEGNTWTVFGSQRPKGFAPLRRPCPGFKERGFQNVKQNYFFLISTSKGLTRRDPDLIPKPVGMIPNWLRDQIGIGSG